MKRCSECGRDYNDDSLSFCLDDGAELLFGPKSLDEPQTAILHGSSNAATSAQIPLTGAGQSGSPDAPKSEYRLAKPLLIAVAIAVLAIGGYFAYRYLSGPDAGQIRSIAVMPFVNGSSDPGMDYLSDGLTETIIKNLSQLTALNVKPRSSVFGYKGREMDARNVGRELQVQAILNGRLDRRGDELTLFVELIDVGAEKVVWSQQYRRNDSDLISLEHEVAKDVSDELRVKLSGAEEQNMLKRYTSNPEAYRLYLRGLNEWNKFTIEGLTRSTSFYQQAIDLDPNYALAYSGMADSHINLAIDFQSPQNHMPKAKAAALRAIELDGSLAEAHSSLGSFLLFFEWDIQGAEQHYRKAIALDPKYANAHHFYSHCLQFSGREAEALREIETAVQLEPLSSLNNAELSWAYYLARQNDAAIDRSMKTIDMDPSFAYAHFVAAQAYNAKGMHREAKASIEKGLSLAPNWLELQLLVAYTQALGGEEKQAREVLDRTLSASKGGYINEVVVAAVHSALGDEANAIEWLERGYQERCSWMAWIAIEPMLAKLRPNPKFQDIVRRIKE